MTYSPNDYYSEGESKMNQISSDKSQKYRSAIESFKKAALAYKSSHNYTRAGDAYRRIVDCCFHINSVEDAANYATESSRCYAKSPETIPLSIETLTLAVKCYKDLGRMGDHSRILIEFARTFEEVGQIDNAIKCLQESAESLFSSSRHFDAIRIYKQLGDMFGRLEKWQDAAAHYEQSAMKCVSISSSIDSHDFATKAVLSNMIALGPTYGRISMDKMGQNIPGWSGSADFEHVKNISDAATTRMESKIKRAVDAFLEIKKSDQSMVAILSICVEALKYKPQRARKAE